MFWWIGSKSYSFYVLRQIPETIEVFSSHPRTASTLYFGHDCIYWGAAEQDDSSILLVMLFVRAVGGFPAYGKSEFFAFPARYCCPWSNEHFVSSIFCCSLQGRYFKRSWGVKRLFLIQFFILGEGSIPKHGLHRLTPLPLCSYHLEKSPEHKNGRLILKGKKKNQFKILFIPSIC